jgi:8-oxo-dGTP pyrophosphatase MutT (NUDIX family)
LGAPAAAVLVAQGRLGYARFMDTLLRHIAACNNARLPGERIAFRLGKDRDVAGWLGGPIASALAAMPGIVVGTDGVWLADPAALEGIVRALAGHGMLRLRGEQFDVRAAPDGLALGRIDRGALPQFGIAAVGVHVNGLVRAPDGVRLWVAHRARDKHLDPGKLDHIVAGGVAAGMTPGQTLVKEAGEEAGIPPSLAARAVPVASIGYAMEREEGLRRDLLHCYDLDLAADFVPHPADGEVERFELWPVARALAEVRAGDAFKFNVNLVLIDLFLRLGMLPGDEGARLRAALDPHPPR